MTNQTVYITFTSQIQQFDETLTIKNNYKGQYIIKNDAHYLRYVDQDSGQITLKYDSTTKTITVLWQNHAIKKMIFSEKKETLSYYHLPQANLPLTVITKKINIIMQSDSIKKIVIYYTLKQENELFGHYKMVYLIHPLLS